MGLFVNGGHDKYEHSHGTARNNAYAYTGQFGAMQVNSRMTPYGNTFNYNYSDWSQILPGLISGVINFGMITAMDLANRSSDTDTDTDVDDDDNDTDTTPDTDNSAKAKEIAEKEKELADVYSEAKITKSGNDYNPANDFKQSINAKESEIVNKNAELTELGNRINTIETQISEMGARPSEPVEEVTRYNNELSRLQEELEKAKDAENTIKDKIDKLKLEKVALQTQQGKAENIKAEIKKLKEGSSGESYDVKKETQDIKKFFEALKAFQNDKTSVEKAQALQAAFEESASDKEQGIQNGTIKSAYALIKDQVKATIASK